MQIEMAPADGDVNRLKIDGELMSRACDFADAEANFVNKEIRTMLLSKYREHNPGVMKLVGDAKLKRGYYFPTALEQSVKDFLKNPEWIEEAYEANRAGALYGAGRREGRKQALESARMTLVVDGEHFIFAPGETEAVQTAITNLEAKVESYASYHAQLEECIAAKDKLIEGFRAMNKNVAPMVRPVSVPEKPRVRVPGNTETWRPIPGNSDELRVSSHGRFYNRRLNKFLNPKRAGKQLQVSSMILRENGRSRQVILNAAKMAALAFCEMREGHSVLHFHDENRFNIIPANMEWVREGDARITKADFAPDTVLCERYAIKGAA